MTEHSFHKRQDRGVSPAHLAMSHRAEGGLLVRAAPLSAVPPIRLVVLAPPRIQPCQNRLVSRRIVEKQVKVDLTSLCLISTFFSTATQLGLLHQPSCLSCPNQQPCLRLRQSRALPRPCLWVASPTAPHHPWLLKASSSSAWAPASLSARTLHVSGQRRRTREGLLQKRSETPMVQARRQDMLPMVKSSDGTTLAATCPSWLSPFCPSSLPASTTRPLVWVQPRLSS